MNIMSLKQEVKKLANALDNYNWNINPDDYPVNGKAIASKLNILKAWKYLTVEEESKVINEIKMLMKSEPVGEI